MKKYNLVKKMPSVNDYLNIRKNTLGEKTRFSGEMAVKNSWIGVHIILKIELIA